MCPELTSTDDSENKQQPQDQLLPISITKEHLRKARELVNGPLADYTDPEWGMPIMTFLGYTLRLTTPLFLQRIRVIPVDESDVYVTSFPKSGTTWMQHIVWYLVTQDFDHKEPIDYAFPELEIPAPYPPRPENIDAFARKDPPRLFKSHHPFELLPRDILKGKIVFVYRNPKDTIVSNFHHCRAMLPQCFDGTFEKFFDLFIEGRVWFGPWYKHIKSYYQAAKEHPSTVMLISYEELKRDRMGAIKKVANFIGKSNLSEEMFQKIYDATSFEAMKKNDSANYSWLIQMGYWDKNLQPFMRKGVVGDWKNYFTPEMQARLDEYMAKNMADCDLEFVDK